MMVGQRRGVRGCARGGTHFDHCGGDGGRHCRYRVVGWTV
ncbi:hypothetical protein SFR_1724 [Streptomyces sp. FR-008]|nr:hypothetical protein SFR_1724 [Streptomyces sp. FR-008]